MSANIVFLYPCRGYYDCVISYTTENTKVCMGHLLKRAEISWKSRPGFWKFHKVKFCVLV